MDIVLNSKFFAELAPTNLGEKALALGYDGIDLCVREGHPVNPDNADRALTSAISTLRDMGLSCPLVTAPVTFNSSRVPAPKRGSPGSRSVTGTSWKGMITGRYWQGPERN